MKIKIQEPLIILNGGSSNIYAIPSGTVLHHSESFPEGHQIYKIYIRVKGEIPASRVEDQGEISKKYALDGSILGYNDVISGIKSGQFSKNDIISLLKSRKITRDELADIVRSVLSE